MRPRLVWIEAYHILSLCIQFGASILSYFSPGHCLARSISMLRKVLFDGFPKDALQCERPKAAQSDGGEFFRLIF
jgi:hypothetical protein